MKYLGFVRANLMRNKLRTLLTGSAIALAVALVCLLLTMPAGLDALLDNVASNTRISVHNKAGIVYSMPASFVRRVRRVDGVAAAMGQTWYGGAYEEEGRVTFPNFAVEVDQVAGVYPDYPIDPKQLADFQRYRDGALVGQQVMVKYGWKIGDRISLKSTVWPVDLDFRIVGEVANERAPFFWFNREYLDQALQAATGQGLGIVGMIWVRAEDPTRVNAIMREIDALSRNSDAETASETEKSFFSAFFGSLQGLVTIILVVTSLVVVCIVVIAANTASMAVRERSGEIAVLKAMGFGRRVIFSTLLAEAVVLAAISGAAGVGFAVGVTRVLRLFAAGGGALGPLGSFILTPDVVAAGLGLSLVVGAVAGLAPAYGAARKPVVEALREVF
jgi:putative ABC transport system permease protein